MRKVESIVAGTFLIIDGSSLVHRAFYALPSRMSTSVGQHTNAVYGFATMLIRLLHDMKPSAALVAFDKGRTTFRNALFGDYKAHRPATPPELSEQFPLVKDLIAAFGIRVIEEDGLEADDIIGTMAKRARDAGNDVVIVSGDRDILQLVRPGVVVMLTKKGISEMEKMDEAAVKSQLGLAPAQIIDLKGLMGDTSDNIPGVPGVGEKTALRLLTAYGSVEKVLENIDAVPGEKLRQALAQNRDLALLSKQLATIDCNAGIDIDPGDCRITPQMEQIREVFSKLEFKSLYSKVEALFPKDAGPSVPASESCAPAAVQNAPPAAVQSSKEELEAILGRWSAGCPVAVLPLTRGRVPDLVLDGVALSDGKDVAYVARGAAQWEAVCRVLADKDLPKTVYDLKHFTNACLQAGIALAGADFDVLLAAYLLNPTATDYPIGKLLAEYLGEPAVSEAETSGFPADRAALWRAAAAFRLRKIMADRLEGDGLIELFKKIELPVAVVLADMEQAGVLIDQDRMATMSAEIAGRLTELVGEIHTLAGGEFNINSPKQLGWILFEKLQLPVIKKTKTGYSTDVEVLEALAGMHPLIDKLLEFRLLAKLKSTYLDGLALLVHSRTNRVHTTFNQTVTATGRLSSSEPNLQNIPVRTDIGRQIRSLFIPGPGYDLIMSADYSQIELRILAALSGDANLVDAFQKKQDVHARTAAEVFGVPLAEVTPQMRSRAKAVNFGIVYGISDYGLSRDIGVSRKEAGEFIARYFARYSGVKRYIDQVVAAAKETGYVTTIFGRRRYLPDINSPVYNLRAFAERTAMNTPIQGSAADIIKAAMIRIHEELRRKNLSSRIILQVHDELVLEVAAPEAEAVAALVREAMETAADLAVPLAVDVKSGRNWAEAK